MGERLRVIWQAIRAGMGLGPRRDISAEARVKRVLEASRDRVEESVRRGEQQLREGRTTSLDDLTQIPQVIGKQRNVIGVERKP